jgi:DNA-binding winged helix-turn-helix (wHTH) protein/TolB-like protein/tetratricopeptide (TPR) repeat protein
VTPYRFDHFEIRPTERRLLVAGRPVPLGARAFDLLLALVERRDRTVTKNELLDLVWPGLVVEENNVQVQISTLRKVLGQDAIATIPGQGYRFTLPEEAEARSVPTIATANNTQSHPVVEAPVPAAPADANGPIGDGVSPRKLRWAAFSAAAIVLVVLAMLSWNYWKPALQTTDTSRISAVGGAAPWFSIAILPFAAPGSAADAQLADSLTRELTVTFGRIRWARVVSYGLASTYKGKAIDARLVGRELNVRYLVEGGVRSAGEGFITDIQLIDAGTATQAWSTRLKLERGSAEQDPGALVAPLTQQLRVALLAAERRRVGTQSAIQPNAMELVLRANNVLDQETDPLKGALEARKLYDEALRLDPNLVWALLGRGWTLQAELYLGGAARDRLVQELDAMSVRAVAIDSDDPMAWALRAHALTWQWRWDAAFEALSKEQSLEPTRARPIFHRAWIMNLLGKPAEALPLVDRGLALDPLDVGFALFLRCRSYLVLGRYKDAINACEKAAGSSQDSWGVHLFLVAAYGHEGEVAKTETAKAALLRRRPGFSIADLNQGELSNEPAWLQQSETHLFAGLRKAGIPER